MQQQRLHRHLLLNKSTSGNNYDAFYLHKRACQVYVGEHTEKQLGSAYQEICIMKQCAIHMTCSKYHSCVDRARCLAVTVAGEANSTRTRAWSVGLLLRQLSQFLLLIMLTYNSFTGISHSLVSLCKLIYM